MESYWASFKLRFEPVLRKRLNVRSSHGVTKKFESRFSKLARVFVCFNHVASGILNANHSIMRAAIELCVVNCVADCVWVTVPQATEWQRIGNQNDAALIFAGADFVNVHGRRLASDISNRKSSTHISDSV